MNRALVLASSLALAGCSTDRVGGGASTDTDNGLVVRLHDAGGAVAGARVEIRRPGIVDTVDVAPYSVGWTDADGVVSFAELPQGSWSLLASLGGSGAFRNILGSDSVVDLDMAPLASIRGEVSSAFWRGGWVVIPGTGRRARIASSDLSFSIDGLPSARWTLVALGEGVGSSRVETDLLPGLSTSGVLLGRSDVVLPVPAVESTMVWTFERQAVSGASFLCDTIGGSCGTWSPSLDTIQVEPPPGASSGATSAVRLVPGVENGFGVGNAPAYADLSELKALVFLARGPGALRISAVSDAAPREDGEIGAVVRLAAGWQRVRLDVTWMQPDSGTASYAQGRRWTTVAGHVQRFRFVAGEGIPGADTVLLDDIELQGISPR